MKTNNPKGKSDTSDVGPKKMFSNVLCLSFSLRYSFCLRICRGVQLAPLCAREV